MQEKQYVVRKYIMAKNAKDALKKEKDVRADEVWLDEDWKRENLSKVIGFKK